jgi:hypothetical protein
MLDIPSFALGFAGGCAVVGNVWLWLHIIREVNAPKKFAEDVLGDLKRDVIV